MFPLGNLKGTCWEQRKNEKKIPPFPPRPPPPPQNLKGKKINAL